MKQSEKTAPRAIKIKDIMRLFFKYDIDQLPVIDRGKRLKGLVDKKLIIQDATDPVFIERPFARLSAKFIFYPEEEFFLQIVSNLPDELRFPVIDGRGNLQHLWLKKDLLNSYYHIDETSRSASPAKEPDYREVIEILPFNILITDARNRIVRANKSFLTELDFEQDILFQQSITRFFPRIVLPGQKHSCFPSIHTIKYRHMDWHYALFSVNGHCLYLFSQNYAVLGLGKEQPPLPPDNQDAPKSASRSLNETMEGRESQMIKKALEESDWNISQAAQTLKIPRQTLQYKISKYRIS